MLHYARGLAGASLPRYILTGDTMCVTHVPLSIPRCVGISEKWPHGIYKIGHLAEGAALPTR
jgi:hypothetical protein